MRLRTLAGAYAGQIREYGIVTGLAALRSGTAEPIDRPAATIVRPVPVATPMAARKARVKTR
jgi:hypothetical protein